MSSTHHIHASTVSKYAAELTLYLLYYYESERHRKSPVCLILSKYRYEKLVELTLSLCNSYHPDLNIISYPLFADADMGIYPHETSQCHARPKAKRSIAMLSVDKFPYPRKQIKGYEFISCSNDVSPHLKTFPRLWNPSYPFYLA